MAKMSAAISASTIRFQIEAALAKKIPSALTPAPRILRPVAATGIEPLDNALHGGLPIGAPTEFIGPECSGRTATALSFVAQITQAAKICAWIDVSNALDPLSAAAIGVDLERMLWVRCGAIQKGTTEPHRFALPEKYFAPPPIKRGLHGGGFGAHPRSEVNGLSDAVGNLLKSEPVPPRQEQLSLPCSDQMPSWSSSSNTPGAPESSSIAKPWLRIEQALRVTDLLLQAGGFSAIVLDFGGISPECVSRIPLATWFRYRAAAERTQSSIVLLTQYGCAKSSAELLLRFHLAAPLCDEATIFTGMRPVIEVVRRRFTQSDCADVLPMRKPPQSTTTFSWPSRTSWTVCR